MDLSILFGGVSCYIYNSMVKEVGSTCLFKVKLAKKVVQESQQIVLHELPLVPEHYKFNSEKWLGLPWVKKSAFKFTRNEMAEADHYYYADIHSIIKESHYYTVGIEHNNITFFTNPIYKTSFGFIYPVILNQGNNFIRMNSGIRVCITDKDDFNRYFWTNHLPLFLFGLLIGILIIVILLRRLCSRRPPDNNMVYLTTK
ncbi:hypothetical protein ECANGB1_1719 [Enterospora canceri]|uniref:Uncharacterized protein n=1 Tax=Enterospora canceri TaxID=1081671 RepID=A0A1Y1SA26_9MICR|nr:hypothetical protein ECANGB1_1719 [Enterospora canceri]